MISSLISRIVMLVLGTLYPAYASYKAIKTKNVKEYVKWMMYWIVFALFTCAETFADIFISWLPFYYELKIAFVLWLLSPATKGSSILYRKFVHPHFAKREQEIDSYIAQASDQGYYALVTLGSKGLNYAANVVVTTAMKGQARIVEQIKSYSMSDLSSPEAMSLKQQPRRNRPITEEEDELDNRLTEERFQSEVMQKEDGEKDRPVSILKRSSSTRVQRSREADLYPVDEIEETASDPERSETYCSKKLISKEMPSSSRHKLRRGRIVALKHS